MPLPFARSSVPDNSSRPAAYSSGGVLVGLAALGQSGRIGFGERRQVIDPVDHQQRVMAAGLGEVEIRRGGDALVAGEAAARVGRVVGGANGQAVTVNHRAYVDGIPRRLAAMRQATAFPRTAWSSATISMSRRRAQGRITVVS